MGTAQVDSETTLLSVLDESMQRGVQTNASVMRRGLKSLINTDFKFENWTAMVTSTYTTMLERFDGTGSDTKEGSSADDFYTITIGQIFQKLLRAATAKFKTKDRTVQSICKTKPACSMLLHDIRHVDDMFSLVFYII